MKRSVCLVFSLWLFFAGAALAQANQTNKKKKPDPKVPTTVLAAFKAQYPDLEVKDWDWEKEKDFYEAEFLMEGVEKEAVFSGEGRWLKTKTEMKKDALPEAIVKALAIDEFTGWKQGDINLIESPGREPYYKIRLEKEKDVQVLKFDGSGTRLVSDKEKDSKSVKK